MRGLLADVNLQGHASYLRQVLEDLGLWSVLDDVGLEFATFSDLNLALDIDDRSLWDHCQAQGWVLLTENRNREGPNSLEATLVDCWQPFCESVNKTMSARPSKGASKARKPKKSTQPAGSAKLARKQPRRAK